MATTAPPPLPPATGTPGWGAGRIIAVIVAGVAAMVALLLLLGGAALVSAHLSVRDDAGFYTTPTERLTSPTAAVAVADIDLGDFEAGSVETVIDELTGVVRISATAADGAPVFVGVARQADVEDYLGGVAYDEVADTSGSGVRLERRGGAIRAAEPPTQANIWVASTSGEGIQRLRWDPSSGRFAAVVMRADGTPGVDVRANVGAKVGWFLGLGVGLLSAGGLLLLLSAVALVVTIRSRPRAADQPLASP